MRLKGQMEVEVLKDTTEADGNKTAARRRKTMVMDAGEQLRYCDDANRARSDEHPGYPTEEQYE